MNAHIAAYNLLDMQPVGTHLVMTGGVDLALKKAPGDNGWVYQWIDGWVPVATLVDHMCYEGVVWALT